MWPSLRGLEYSLDKLQRLAPAFDSSPEPHNRDRSPVRVVVVLVSVENPRPPRTISRT